jgi:hypothetical protein
VARVLVQQHKDRPRPTSIVERLIARSQKGASASECAAFLAKELLASCQVGAQQSPRQTDLASVSAQIGLSIEYKPLAVDALLQETASGYLAVVDSTTAPARQRMSLAHEIAHLMLYRKTGLQQAFGHISRTERTTVEATEIEQLCDHFARELTMPADIWQQAITNAGLSVTTLLRLRSIFGVSIASAAKRILEISTVDCTFILWQAVFEQGIIAKLDAVKCWGTSDLLEDVLGQNLQHPFDLPTSGSPFLALAQKNISAGRISLSIKGKPRKYLAQSGHIDSTHAVTLLVPEEVGWQAIFPKGNSHNDPVVFRSIKKDLR